MIAILPLTSIEIIKLITWFWLGPQSRKASRDIFRDNLLHFVVIGLGRSPIIRKQCDNTECLLRHPDDARTPITGR